MTRGAIDAAGRLRRAMSMREWLGAALGVAWAPGIAAIARTRRARMFHPEGIAIEGRVEPVDGDPLGARLGGRVLARFSGALWKHWERVDVLGIALRIRDGGASFDAHAAEGDQDLLFATIRSPFTMGVAPLSTHTRDFYANRYWAVSPFEIGEPRHVKLRLSPVEPQVHDVGDTRGDRLRLALADARADLWLEARQTFAAGYRRIARLCLVREVDLDHAALRFDPFRTGAGIVPSGFVHAIRRAAYPASQGARPRGGA